MPTFVAFKGGNKVDEFAGANPQALQVSAVAVIRFSQLLTTTTLQTLLQKL